MQNGWEGGPRATEQRLALLVSRLSAAALTRNAGLNVTYSPVTTVLLSCTASYEKPADGPQQSLLHPSRERETGSITPRPRVLFRGDHCASEALPRQLLDARQSIDAYRLRVPDLRLQRGPQHRDLDR